VAEIAEIITQERPAAATAWVNDTFLAVRTLQRSPLRGPMVAGPGREDVRQLLHGQFRVICRVSPTR
jgi:plasmid stabilization system protein ParE